MSCLNRRNYKSHFVGWQRFQLASIDNDSWGPKDKALRKEWRMKYANQKLSALRPSQEPTEPAVLNKFEAVDEKHICADNPAFVADIP